jgi:hypothetical protein
VESVIRTNPNARELSRHVTELPAEFEVQRLDDHWLVAGPTGIFAVGRTDRDVTSDAARTSVLAHDVRTALSDLMPWVPFVDSLLVVHHDQVGDLDLAGLACTVVELDMLPIALTAGAEVIGPDELMELYQQLPLVVSSLQHDQLGQRPTPHPA